MIRVLLADDQKLVRDGWCALLDHSSGISVIGQARDGLEAVELAKQMCPDLVLMDVKMPRLDGLEATRKIVQQQYRTKVLMVTQSLDEALVRTAMQHGAWGYVSKNDMFDELLPAILALQAGQLYFSKAIREHYRYVEDELRSPVTFRRHNWQDAAWALLDNRLERAMMEAQTSRDRARSVHEQSETLRAQSRKARAFTHQLLRLRHPDAPAAI